MIQQFKHTEMTLDDELNNTSKMHIHSVSNNIKNNNIQNIVVKSPTFIEHKDSN